MADEKHRCRAGHGSFGLAPRKLAAYRPHDTTRVIAQHVHAIGEQCARRLRIQRRALGNEMRTRRFAPHARKTQGPEETDPQPADINLPGLHGEARGARESVMVVVQLLAAEEQRPRHDIRRRRWHLEAAVAQAMTDAVDHAAGEERLRGQVNGHHHNGGDTEQNKLGQNEENEPAGGQRL